MTRREVWDSRHKINKDVLEKICRDNRGWAFQMPDKSSSWWLGDAMARTDYSRGSVIIAICEARGS